MAPSIESLMESLAELQLKRPIAIVVAALVVTLILGFGFPNIRMETDFNKELPQDIPIIKLNNRVSDEFGGQDVVLLVVRLDYDSDDTDAVRDIRDPRVMEMLLKLEERISKDERISSVRSIGSAFQGRENYLTDLETVKAFLSNVPQADSAFNRDYSATLLYAFADLGSGEESIKDLEAEVNKEIEAAYKPPGVRVSLTGTPSIRTELMDILQADAVYTIALAAAIILILLLVISRPMSRGLMVFSPLVFGLSWTLGFMGWADIPLSIATVGIGAMILGLGVEYGVFYVSRYEEERDLDRSQEDSLRTALTEVGSAIVGSSLTTIAGFLALLFASMPMLHHLGFALAFGILCCVTSALVVNPALIVVEEKITHAFESKRYEKLSKKFNGGEI